MKINLKGYAENLLFALNIFILFFLVFESKITVPFWLQPVGRMHPIFLHFPIVLLLLAMVLEFFRFATKYHTQEFYQTFTSNLFLAGLLTSAVTVLMGLFLSKEEGYEGGILQWHKWLGVGILLFATLVYWSRQYRWYTGTIAKTGALVTTFTLIFVGHYGAILTHGDNFILEPITIAEVPNVPVEQAEMFEHVIQPLFEKKCVSCHNPDKLKGKLALIDSAAMQKGGKTGKLFVAGKPEVSLLMKRIYLPVADKKHMPPANKTQLTPEEVKLLHLWVKEDADFSKKVIDFPAGDSLRVLATNFLKPVEDAGIAYDFAAADEKTIQKLNTNYRVITPLATESPALAVNVYNKQAFNTNTLADLKEVNQQIVSLELNKLPVKDADLKNIGQFKNLRWLNLNFTDITGKGLAELSQLKHLESLSLAGTNLHYKDLQKQIANFKNLRTVTLWNTGLADAEIKQLQHTYKTINFISGFKDDGTTLIKLNPPQLKNSSPIFRETLPLQLFHPIKGVTIRYTLDGSVPDSITSPIFKNGTTLAGMTTLKAKAFKTGWLGSEVAVFNFYRSSFKPDSVRLAYPLNRVHQANGPKTFFDGELGTFNANSPAWANNWGGFYKHPMELISEFKQPVTISAIALNTLIESENNIFPPEVIEVWGATTLNKWQHLATLKPEQPTKVNKPVIKLVESKFKPHQVSYLKIIAKPLKGLPGWHKSKGSPALLLIDEVFLN
ncbi:c-type cytochrome domain-containing protein [Adhaeribacter radiodurans]|uniref:Chitobiase/beta-hexosaminidase C-terminal domain-containing protein n=1 Tax=Adhaeribacter radiodurans TaxID=2745197 RepID=A0A7L7L6W4_9BACT|nr:c-type cytochrome domain-containing protein [Adhaeribacter radiodurans]QMU28576.1 chitobiase/beta-hexosaminidase C-terminal domain-containing protein [Adhaeribacter radiodurans]